MGADRDLKKMVEKFWANKITFDQLQSDSKDLRAKHLLIQKDAGIDFIPSNDASFYDHVLDHLYAFGAIPSRYQSIQNPIDKYFAMGRGLQNPALGIDVPAMEMKKWFDTNYHYIVGEFSAKTKFELNPVKIVGHFLEAKDLGIITRPVILGPVTFLALGKASSEDPSFDPLTLLPQVLPVYVELLKQLKDAGAEWIQFDEPILSLSRPDSYKEYYKLAYETIAKEVPELKYLLASYFGRYSSNIEFVINLPVNAIHLDTIRAPGDLDIVLPRLKAAKKMVSVGVVEGRNIWKVDYSIAIKKVEQCIALLGSENVIVGPSCSLLHSPHSLAREVKMDSNIKSWMSFACEKIHEITTIVKAVKGEDVKTELAANAAAIAARKSSPLVHNPKVQEEMKSITPDMFKRQSPFNVREQKQQAKLNLPPYPTTTVGSFPQTQQVRVARQKFKKGESTQQEYDAFINEEIAKAVKFQETVGLDMLVHGEFERNDMVEYFGENLDGYVFSQFGWVQSYGSRCVKPPIIFGDVARPKPITVETSVYAQSLTKLPMKGMLTGPVTMLQWSFVRDDQPRKDTCFQIALALRKEVSDLAKAGIPAIQIDEVPFTNIARYS